MQTIDTVNLYSHTRATVTNIRLLSNPGLGSEMSWNFCQAYGFKEILKAPGDSYRKGSLFLSSGFELTRKVKDFLFVYELIQSLK